ncbi:restriction endonuclease subunit S [Qipengyuania marisflavi]|uniref:Restriction endonuclease subunit S n=1 Tax=Qipengyuania marisflavi TaxID=2486356 RepID=A0A5S3P522_9SPHN|nr:restriction endonuclease subunit S [Qipengyuania marisflavi]TMM45826.1 restriction endonuclease subunit S [Qipengyuania marisflavi]
MTLAPYADYQPSPAGWIGQIPAHWDVERIKFSLSERSKVIASGLPAGAISYGRVVEKDGEKILPETLASYQEVRAGEFLINPINLNYDLVSLRTALSELNVVVSPAYIVLRANEAKLDTRYGKYLLHIFDIRHMKTLGAGIRQTIGFSDIGNCKWVLPPLDEQSLIADYIDRETCRIDELIVKKQGLVQLLKEKRDAMISRIVTKGLNPSGATRSAKASWLSAIPRHWSEAPFSAVSEERKTKNMGMRENNLLSLSYGKIVRKDINTNDGLLPASFETYQIIERDDVIFRFTDLQNDKRSLRSAISTERGIITSAYLAVALKGIVPAYFNYLMRAYDLHKVFYAMGGGLRQSLNYDDVKRMPILLPTRDEQIDIINILDRETVRIDSLVQKVTSSIELLREHRTALITAAVTGKIDVRNAA